MGMVAGRPNAKVPVIRKNANRKRNNNKRTTWHGKPKDGIIVLFVSNGIVSIGTKPYYQHWLNSVMTLIPVVLVLVLVLALVVLLQTVVCLSNKTTTQLLNK